MATPKHMAAPGRGTDAEVRRTAAKVPEPSPETDDAGKPDRAPWSAWRPDENRTIRKGFEEGLTVEQIARHLPGRTESSVKMHAWRLGLRSKNNNVWEPAEDAALVRAAKAGGGDLTLGEIARKALPELNRRRTVRSAAERARKILPKGMWRPVARPDWIDPAANPRWGGGADRALARAAAKSSSYAETSRRLVAAGYQFGPQAVRTRCLGLGVVPGYGRVDPGVLASLDRAIEGAADSIGLRPSQVVTLIRRMYA